MHQISTFKENCNQYSKSILEYLKMITLRNEADGNELYSKISCSKIIRQTASMFDHFNFKTTAVRSSFSLVNT